MRVQRYPPVGVSGAEPLVGCGARAPHAGDFAELEVSRTSYYAFPIIVGRPPLPSFGLGDGEKEGQERSW